MAACRRRGGGSTTRLPGGVGSRVLVVERASAALAVYDIDQRRIVGRIGGFGDMRHATMVFAHDLRHAYVATRSGQLSRVDLETLQRTGDVEVSRNSIDIAISQDGRFIATAEYVPGGVTIIDERTLRVLQRIPATMQHNGAAVLSRVTGMVDAPGNRFVCTLMEGAEVWVIDASRPDFPVERRIPMQLGAAYDAMITPDGRYYVVGHQNSDDVTVVDLSRIDQGARTVSMRDPNASFQTAVPVKLPHLASWAVARTWAFVPGMGEHRLIVLDRTTWRFERSIPLRGNPVYAVRAPNEREIWVSFSGEDDDRFVQIVDTETLAVTATLEVGRRIYHMDFTPRGSHVLVSANADNRLVLVNASTHAFEDVETLRSPSGVFGPWRAFAAGL